MNNNLNTDPSIPQNSVPDTIPETNEPEITETSTQRLPQVQNETEPDKNKEQGETSKAISRTIDESQTSTQQKDPSVIYGSNGMYENISSGQLDFKEKYNDFIESSDLLIEFYHRQQTFGLEKYFIDIEEWLNAEVEDESDNLPLVIEAEEGVGKKTLLVKWIQYHENSVKQDFDDIIIPHFASAGGNNSNSFYAIYRILIKLRDVFNINQKVELLEEKIRKNFNYWLELCSQKADSSVVYDGKVILIIEGLESFKDFDTGTESNIKFWLPKTFPKNIKVVTTAAKGSKSYKYLKNIGCKVIELRSNSKMLSNKVHSLENRIFFCTKSHKEKVFKILNEKIENKEISSMFLKIVISSFCPYLSEGLLNAEDVDEQKVQEILSHVDYEKIEIAKDTQELISYILEFFEDKIIEPEKYKAVFCCLSLTFKGLKIQEILDICNISFNEWKLLITFYKPFFFSFKGFWKVGNDIILRAIQKKFFDDDEYSKQFQIPIEN